MEYAVIEIGTDGTERLVEIVRDKITAQVIAGVEALIAKNNGLSNVQYVIYDDRRKVSKAKTFVKKKFDYYLHKNTKSIL